MRPGMISARAGRKLATKRRRRSGYNYGGTSADGRELSRDEGQDRGGGAMPPDNELDSREYQAGGRPSRSGGIYGGEQNPTPAKHINAPRNARQWAPGTSVKRRSMQQGVQGGVAGSTGNPGNWYSGGKGR